MERYVRKITKESSIITRLWITSELSMKVWR